MGVTRPVATPCDTARAGCRPCWINLCVARITSMPVLTPLPHIPVHVIQTPLIRQLQPHGLRILQSRIPGILSIPRVIPQPTLVIPKRPPTGRPCTTGILPFCLRRQTVDLLPCRFIQLADKLLQVVPRYIRRRMTRIRLDVTLPRPRGGAQHTPPLTLGNLILPQVKPLADRHLVLRPFTRNPSGFRRRRSHRKRPWFDPHELHRRSAR